jgi:hypothetical protein
LDVATGGTPDAPAMTAALSPFTLARASSRWQLLQQPDQSVVLRSPAGNVCLRAGSGGKHIRSCAFISESGRALTQSFHHRIRPRAAVLQPRRPIPALLRAPIRSGANQD